MAECPCSESFSPRLAPCPEGLEGCCVAHYNEDSYICQKCGRDHGPEFARAIAEGRIKYDEVAISVVNVAAAAKLEFYTEKK
jgi:hypothetical protein